MKGRAEEDMLSRPGEPPAAAAAPRAAAGTKGLASTLPVEALVRVMTVLDPTEPGS